jgi:hypothetical protein
MQVGLPLQVRVVFPLCEADTALVAAAISVEPLISVSENLDRRQQPSGAGDTTKKGTAHVVRAILSESLPTQDWSLHMDAVDPIKSKKNENFTSY